MVTRSDPAVYTDPDLRDRLRAEIQAGDKGGRPGQWSARKAQLLARAYASAGGGYLTDKAHEGEQARHLDEWTAEDWQTRTGSARAREGEETARYLPRAAWEALPDEEAERTDRRKRQASRKGRQFVPNTEAAEAAGRAVRDHPDAEPLPGYDAMSVPQVRAQLGTLDEVGLAHVLAYERAHRNRRSLLPQVERALARTQQADESVSAR